MRRVWIATAAAALGGAVVGVGCSDDDTGGAAGAGGSGGGTTTAATTSAATTSAATTSAATSSTGGEGGGGLGGESGTGGDPGAGGAPGAGGSSPGCDPDDWSGVSSVAVTGGGTYCLNETDAGCPDTDTADCLINLHCDTFDIDPTLDDGPDVVDGQCCYGGTDMPCE